MTDLTPQPTPRPQHLDALAEANRVRLGIAAAKRAIAAGDLLLDAALVGDAGDHGEFIDRTPILDVLVSARRVGRSVALKVLTPIPVSETRKVGALTARQRQAIVDGLRYRAPWTCARRTGVAA